jgi:hypothetical protein
MMLATTPMPNGGCSYELAGLALLPRPPFRAAKPVPMEPLLKVEQASQSVLTPLGREGLAVLLPP